jgi:hypothetical protein
VRRAPRFYRSFNSLKRSKHVGDVRSSVRESWFWAISTAKYVAARGTTQKHTPPPNAM